MAGSKIEAQIGTLDLPIFRDLSSMDFHDTIPTQDEFHVHDRNLWKWVQYIFLRV